MISFWWKPILSLLYSSLIETKDAKNHTESYDLLVGIVQNFFSPFPLTFTHCCITYWIISWMCFLWTKRYAQIIKPKPHYCIMLSWLSVWEVTIAITFQWLLLIVIELFWRCIVVSCTNNLMKLIKDKCLNLNKKSIITRKSKYMNIQEVSCL